MYLIKNRARVYYLTLRDIIYWMHNVVGRLATIWRIYPPLLFLNGIERVVSAMFQLVSFKDFPASNWMVLNRWRSTRHTFLAINCASSVLYIYQCPSACSKLHTRADHFFGLWQLRVSFQGSLFWIIHWTDIWHRVRI